MQSLPSCLKSSHLICKVSVVERTPRGCQPMAPDPAACQGKSAPGGRLHSAWESLLPPQEHVDPVPGLLVRTATSLHDNPARDASYPGSQQGNQRPERQNSLSQITQQAEDLSKGHLSGESSPPVLEQELQSVHTGGARGPPPSTWTWHLETMSV